MKTPPKVANGKNSTEFWVVAAFFADLLAKRFNLYDWVSPEQMTSVAEQIGEITRQLKVETNTESIAIYVLAGIYVGGRILLKWQKNSIDAKAASIQE